MKYDRDLVIKALECCTTKGRSMCDECPLKDECESNPFESAIAKYSFELIKELAEEVCKFEKAYDCADAACTALSTKIDDMSATIERLTEQRNTYREYAYQMHAMVEGIRVKIDEGYEFSVAKHAAEMDMWRVIAAEKQALQDEIKMRKADTEELYKEMSERITEERKIERMLTLRRVHANLLRYTESVGECTIDNPLVETYSVVREEDIDRVVNEMLEDKNAVH